MTEHKKLISIITPCYNEELNVEENHRQVAELFAALPLYEYEHIFIDNASKDTTASVLKRMAEHDRRVKVIVNARNFGHIRSPYHAMLQAQGDAVILLFADLQDPPAIIKDFIKKWEEGFKVVIGVKTQSQEAAWMFLVRKMYYNLIKRFAEIEQIKNFNGFGLYDKKFVDALREIDDPYPYFRGLIGEVGFERAEIEYTQAERKRGKSSNNFYTLYDIAMLGFVNHSKIPLRLASFLGFGMSMVSFVIAFIYLVYKLLYWNRFEAGLAPLTIGIFFFGSVQLFFIGILGEYVGAIYTQVKHRPLVVEKERFNF